MTPRLRIVLPSAFGAITLPLTLWDIHNWNVIISMGMAWDMGAPVWPFQTSDILLRLLNFPAYFFAMPMSNLLRLAAPWHHLLVFPLALLWWAVVGFQLDRGSQRRLNNCSWAKFAVLLLIDLILIVTGAAASISALKWWFRYGHSWTSPDILLMLRFLTPALWCFAAAFFLGIGTRRASVDSTPNH